MKRFVEGTDRCQVTLSPECVEDWIGENNPVRVIWVSAVLIRRPKADLPTILLFC